ncbi:MAG: hypothetical protein V1779_09800 [bacterium]
MRKNILLLFILLLPACSGSGLIYDYRQTDKSKHDFIRKVLMNPENYIKLLDSFDFSTKIFKSSNIHGNESDTILTSVITNIVNNHFDKNTYPVYCDEKFESYDFDKKEVIYIHEIRLRSKIIEDLLIFQWKLVNGKWEYLGFFWDPMQSCKGARL